MLTPMMLLRKIKVQLTRQSTTTQLTPLELKPHMVSVTVLSFRTSCLEKNTSKCAIYYLMFSMYSFISNYEHPGISGRLL